MRALHLLGASIVAAAVGATLFVAHLLFLQSVLVNSWRLPSDTWAAYVIAVAWCVPLCLGLVWPALTLVERRRKRPLGPVLAAGLAAVLTVPVATILLTQWLHYPLGLELLRRGWNVYVYFAAAGLVFGAAYGRCARATATTEDRPPVGA